MGFIWISLFYIEIDKELLKQVLLKGDVASKVLATKIIFEREIPLIDQVDSIVNSWGNTVLNSSEMFHFLLQMIYQDCTQSTLKELLITSPHQTHLSPLHINNRYQVMRDAHHIFL